MPFWPPSRRRALLDATDEDAQALRQRLEVTLAQIQAPQGALDAAAASLIERVQADPADLLAWQALVPMLGQLGRSEQALALLEKAFAADEPLLDLFPIAAQVHSSLGHEAEVEAALRRYVEGSETAAAYFPLIDHFSGQRDAESVTRRFVHLAENHRHLAQDSGFVHLVVKIIAFPRSFPDTGKH